MKLFFFTVTGWPSGSPGVKVSHNDLWVLVDDHAQQCEGGSGTAQSRQLVPKQQLGEQQVAHHIQVAQYVQGNSGGQGNDTTAGQVIKHWPQTAEQDEAPEMVVILEGGLKCSPVFQGQSGNGQDAEARDGHQVQQEDGVDLLLLEQDAWQLHMYKEKGWELYTLGVV